MTDIEKLRNAIKVLKLHKEIGTGEPDALGKCEDALEYIIAFAEAYIEKEIAHGATASDGQRCFGLNERRKV